MNKHTQDPLFPELPYDDEEEIPVGEDDDVGSADEADDGSLDPATDSSELEDTAPDGEAEPESDGEPEFEGDVEAEPEADGEPDASDADVAAEPASEAELPDPDEESDFFADGHHSMLDPGQEAVNDFFGPPRLNRERLPRPPLLPKWVPVLAMIVGGAVLFGLLSLWWGSLSATIETPKLVGVDVGTASTRLAERGLKITVSERRFSPQARDTVLSQDPDPGVRLRSGDSVSVVISAGSEQFAVPDVVGKGLLLARGLLQSKGLEISVESQPSQQPSDTVLACNPAPGSMVHTGDIIRLTVASPGQTTQLLLPYDMKGVTVLLDPVPVADAMTDVPLDVARRLRSLIEASGGTVVTTRALAETSTLEGVDARAQRAAEQSSTVAIGLSTVPVGGKGITVFSPSPVLPHASASSKLASLVTTDLASRSGAVDASTLSSDTVLTAADSPWIRLQLGAFSQKEDVARFADPAWEDSVARSLYKAIAVRYGRKGGSSP
jgi:hypothetical protein